MKSSTFFFLETSKASLKEVLTAFLIGPILEIKGKATPTARVIAMILGFHVASELMGTRIT